MNKRHEIKNLISDHQPIWFALQETHFKCTDQVTVCGYISFRKDFHSSERATAGVALFISNYFPIFCSIPFNLICVVQHVLYGSCTVKTQQTN